MNCGIFETEARAEQSSLEQEKNQILDGLVILVGLGPLSEVLNDAVVGVDLEVLLGCHVAHGGGVAESLGLHDPLHVGGPPVLGGDDAAGRADQSAGDDDLFNLLVKNVLHDRDKVFTIKLLQLLNNILIDGLSHVDNLESSLLQSLDKGGGSNNLLTLTSNVVDVLLVLLHPR